MWQHLGRRLHLYRAAMRRFRELPRRHLHHNQWGFHLLKHTLQRAHPLLVTLCIRHSAWVKHGDHGGRRHIYTRSLYQISASWSPSPATLPGPVRPSKGLISRPVCPITLNHRLARPRPRPPRSRLLHRFRHRVRFRVPRSRRHPSHHLSSGHHLQTCATRRPPRRKPGPPILQPPEQRRRRFSAPDVHHYVMQAHRHKLPRGQSDHRSLHLIHDVLPR